MKTTLTALAFVLAASLMLPSPAQAQSYEDMILQNKDYDPSKPRNPQRDNELNSKALYGETEGGLSDDTGVDHEIASGTGEDNPEQSYDEQALPGGGPKDLYSYIGEDRDNSEASMGEKRTRAAKKAHEEALKTQKNQLKKLQANTDRLVREQKERAWKLANPGQEYPGATGDDDDGTAEPDMDDDSADAGDDGTGGEDGSDTADAGGGDDAAPDDKDTGDTANVVDGGDSGDEGGAEGGDTAGTEQADAGADNVTITNVQ